MTSHIKQLYLRADHIFGGRPISFESTPCWTERLYLIADNSKIKVMLNISKQDCIMWRAVSTLSTMNLAYTITPNTLFKHCISPIEQHSFHPYVERVMQSIWRDHNTLHHPSFTVLTPIILLTLTLWTLNSLIPIWIYNFYTVLSCRQKWCCGGFLVHVHLNRNNIMNMIIW